MGDTFDLYLALGTLAFFVLLWYAISRGQNDEDV